MTSNSSLLRFSLIVPCYNEAEHLHKNVETILTTLKKLNETWELILADDGSHDDTFAVAKVIADTNSNISVFHHEPNQGKGAVLRSAMQTAHGEWIGFIDADLEIPAHYLHQVIDAMRSGSDIAVGSKFLSGSSTQRSLARNIAHYGYRILTWFLLGGGLADDQCGLKCYKRSVLMNILPYSQENSWGWDTEMITFALKNNLRIVEIPVKTFACRTSRVAPFQAAWQTFKVLLRLRRRGLHL
ncbi:MAG: hypothetical protein COS94_04070 [Candidatus Hydrogenedentes bacterium CG07_land_8_20_14_0_80_42_17]|nr:MAG: hypothetical protein COS94_04070 [Candidatus Hydrogenedentes bacterium CG07_land_8_20_14_0_80_42_17]